MHFTFEYNGDRIVGINVTEKLQEVLLPQDGSSLDVTFTYSASWKENTAYVWAISFFGQTESGGVRL